MQKLLSQPVCEFRADLAAIVVVGLAINLAVIAPLIGGLWIQVPLGLVFVLVIPGYTFVGALFPEYDEDPTQDGTESEEAEHKRISVDSLRSKIDGLERTLLSIRLSIATIALFGSLAVVNHHTALDLHSSQHA